MTLVKVQNPVRKAFDAANDHLKETHSALNKYSKALDKVSQTTRLKRRYDFGFSDMSTDTNCILFCG
jgi:hypothetical protein